VNTFRLWLLAAAACVPKGRYEIVEVQLEATQIALSERTAQATIDVLALEAEIARLGEEIAARQRQLDELAARAELRDAALASVTAAIAELAADLEQVRGRLAEREAELARLRRKPVPAPPAPESIEDPAARIAVAVEAQRARDIDESRKAAARAEDAVAFHDLVADGRAELDVRDGATVLRVQSRLLFQEGFTTLSPRGEQIVAAIASGLARVPGRVVTVEGHTDNVEVPTITLASNWDRGFSRAVAVLRGIEGAPAHFVITSFGGTRPIADNATPEGRDRNRRVELVIALDPDLPTAFDPTRAEAPADDPL
jgi:chemotaxis protein MotB